MANIALIRKSCIDGNKFLLTEVDKYTGQYIPLSSIWFKNLTDAEEYAHKNNLRISYGFKVINRGLKDL